MGLFFKLFFGIVAAFPFTQTQLQQAASPHIYQNSSYSIRLGENFSLERSQVSAPASLIKLFTSELSFHSLASDFKFRTQVNWQSHAEEGVISQLTLRGEGDPDFSIDALVQGLVRRGVTHIAGSLTILDRLARVTPKDRNQVSDSGYCYNSLSNALNKKQNCVNMRITANGYSFSDPDIAAPVKVTRRFGADYNSTRPHFRWINQEEGTWQYEIQVSLKNRGESVSVDLLIPDTRKWIINKFRRKAEESGIEFIEESEVSNNQLESQSFSVYSRPMDDLLCEAITNSHNMVADAFFRMVPSSDKREFFANFSDSTFAEGTGLSRDNFISSQSMLDLLVDIQNGSRFNFYLNCLPRPQQEGTLEKRLKGLTEQASLKTGSLGGMSHLAGFVRESQESPWVPFVFMYENKQKTVRELRRSQDKILSELLNP